MRPVFLLPLALGCTALGMAYLPQPAAPHAARPALSAAPMSDPARGAMQIACRFHAYTAIDLGKLADLSGTFEAALDACVNRNDHPAR